MNYFFKILLSNPCYCWNIFRVRTFNLFAFGDLIKNGKRNKKAELTQHFWLWQRC